MILLGYMFINAVPVFFIDTFSLGIYIAKCRKARVGNNWKLIDVIGPRGTLRDIKGHYGMTIGPQTLYRVA